MHRDGHCHETMVWYRPLEDVVACSPTLEESYGRATTQEPIIEGGSLVSPGLARDRFLTAKQGRLLYQRHCSESSETPRCRGWAPLVDRPADYLPSGTVGQWLPVPCNGGPCTRAATRKPTRRGRLGPGAGIPKRTRPKLPPNGVLSNQRGLHQCEKGRGPKDPTVRREGTREPWRRGAICCCGLSRQPQARSGQTVGEDRPTSLPSSSTVVIQFLDKVLNFRAVLRRHGTHRAATRCPLRLHPEFHFCCPSRDCIMSIFLDDGTPCHCRTPPVNDVGRFSELAC